MHCDRAGGRGCGGAADRLCRRSCDQPGHQPPDDDAGLDLNILAGRIDAIGGKPFGSLIVSVPGDVASLGATLASLKLLGLKVEQLGYLETPAAAEARHDA